MSDSLADLQTTLAAVLAELAGVKARVAMIEEVVRIQKEESGARRVTLDCTDFYLRPASHPETVAIHMGADALGGCLSLNYPVPHAEQPAMSLGIEEGEPHLQLLGRDGRLCADTFILEGSGLTAVFGPGGAPAAVMRGRQGGGSVAVMQPDGAVRGVLLYDESEADGEKPAAELILARGNGEPILKLRADDGGGMMTVGPSGQPDALALVARESGPAILMHGPDSVHSVSIVAAEHMAEVCAHQGAVPEAGSQACMSAGPFGSSLVMKGPQGEKGADISALDMASTFTLHDGTGEERIMLCHHFGSHSAFSMKGLSVHDGLRALTTEEVSSFEVISPKEPETKILSALTADKPVTLVQKNRRPILMFGEGEQGGIICAYGPTAQHAGIASLSGGAITGSLALATVDGTAQLTLDATDHGGRLLINNDLGFQRIAMGVYQEAAGLHLNNTGSIGVQAIATPRGGVVTVSDPEGRTVATLPEREDEDSGSWGRLPDGF